MLKDQFAPSTGHTQTLGKVVLSLTYLRHLLHTAPFKQTHHHAQRGLSPESNWVTRVQAAAAHIHMQHSWGKCRYKTPGPRQKYLHSGFSYMCAHTDINKTNEKLFSFTDPVTTIYYLVNVERSPMNTISFVF